MAGILDPGDSQIPSRKLNDVNDPSPGVIVSTANVSGSIIQPYYGQLGKRLVCTFAMASKLSDLTIGQLYEGIYQYVKFDAAGARGQVYYWNTGAGPLLTSTLTNGPYENFNVTSAPSTGGTSGVVNPIAGVALNTVTAGNYGYIQIAGKASIKFRNPITNGNGGINLLALANGATDGTADILNAASPLLMNLANLVLGITLQTPSSNVISLVDMFNLRQVMGGFGGF